MCHQLDVEMAPSHRHLGMMSLRLGYFGDLRGTCERGAEVLEAEMPHQLACVDHAPRVVDLLVQHRDLLRREHGRLRCTRFAALHGELRHDGYSSRSGCSRTIRS